MSKVKFSQSSELRIGFIPSMRHFFVFCLSSIFTKLRQPEQNFKTVALKLKLSKLNPSFGKKFFNKPVVYPYRIRHHAGVPCFFFLRRVQKSVGIAISEFHQTSVHQDRRLMNPLSVYVSVSVSVTRCKGGYTVSVRYDAVAWLDMGAIEL